MDLDEIPPPQKFYGSNFGQLRNGFVALRRAIDAVTATGIDLEIPPIPEGSSEFETTAVITTFIVPLDNFVYFRNADIEGHPDDIGKWSTGATTRAEHASQEDPGEDHGFPIHTDVIGLPVLLRMQPTNEEDPETFWLGNTEAIYYLAQTRLFQFVQRLADYTHDLHEWFLAAGEIIEGGSSSIAGMDEVKKAFDALREEWGKVVKWKSHGGKK